METRHLTCHMQPDPMYLCPFLQLSQQVQGTEFSLKYCFHDFDEYARKYLK